VGQGAHAHGPVPEGPGTGIDQFRGPGKKVVLYPDELKSGNIIYPYAAAKN
jgi:hypothetical protein